MSKGLYLCTIVASAVTFTTGMIHAEVTGSILGRVTDPSMAVIQGVRVTATNVETNQVKEALTDVDGQYRILSLPIGQYKVEATFSGFQTFVATGIALAVDDQRRGQRLLERA